MDAVTTAWLSGLLEGEGWFGIDGVPTIELEMKDLDVIQRVADIWGVSYIRTRERQPNQTIYRVRIRGERARKVMREVLPYMGERRSSRITSLLEG